MRLGPMIGVLLVLMSLSPLSSTGARSQAYCDRAARAFGMTSKAVEATTKRWTDCLSTGSQCDAEHQDVQKAQNTMARAWAEARRQCPDLAQ